MTEMWRRMSTGEKAALVAFLTAFASWASMGTFIAVVINDGFMSPLGTGQRYIMIAATVTIYFITKKAVHNWCMRATVHKDANSPSDPPTSGTPGAA